MKLFVGLGNPGAKYARHRHNVGFMAVERIAAVHGLGPWRKKFQGLVAEGEIAGGRVLLLKPETYMNESGRAVGEAARFLKIGVEDIIVFHDELDLAPGKVRCKVGGGNAGHNGLRSITQHLGNAYARVRIGIGHPGAKELVHGYVLHDFAKVEEAWLDPLLEAMAASAGRLAMGDGERFLTDLALARGDGGEDEPTDKARQPSSDTVKEPRRTREGGHPAGESMGKRQSALAENLRKWLAGKKSGA
jgi:PTH1 family peptidyl-tRNA hydrolase